MSKRLSLIYFSATGGTAKVTKGVAEGISDNYKEYDITSPINRKESITFDSNDLVIVGVPVYAGRVPKFLIDFFTKIKGNHTPAVFITVYGNRNYDDALIELKDTFESNGFIGISAGAFIAEHSNTTKVGTNRPDIEDLKTANKFGADIKNKLENLEDMSQLPKLIVKGNVPYKERISVPPIVPDTNDACTKCGICAKYCPMGAISINNFKDIDAAKCVRCCSCIKKCPVNAKSINHEVFNKITKGLIDNFSTIRNEPECF
ncbi:EFR1 family ferrodoxin [Lacrimispora sp.]|uniref:EFR1 family ferrodoxin n=1 Tax=Lacrimispora sp. TaxID=2719234 RepID=UPI00289CC7D5|nr:EFR1 family ferrodoxin [Lacrimispora sp.]